MSTELTARPSYSERMAEPLYVPAPLGGTSQRMLAGFADALRDQVIEGFHLYDVQVTTDWWPETDTIVKVRLLVDDPPAPAELWSAEQSLALSLAIDRLAWEFGIAEPTSVHEVSLRCAIEAGVPAETVARARAAAGSRADQRPKPGP
jgi:hypothetical protein